MKKLFKEFCELNDRIRSKKGKAPNPKIIKAVYFIPILMSIGIVFSILIFKIKKIKKNETHNYFNDRNYKKVIKEGVLFTTIEYHEK